MKIVNREISWLAFNDRVLQEAADPSVPLIERMRFLGIFSNNRDEFFRVRVAVLKRITDLGKRGVALYGSDPGKLLDEIQRTVVSQEKKFQRTYRQIIKELAQKDVHIISEKQLSEKQAGFVKKYFDETVRSALVPIMLKQKGDFPFLREQRVYLAVKLYDKKSPEDFHYALMEIPAEQFGRFLVLPEEEGKKYLILLDDVIRACLHEVFALFDFDTIESYTIKITRDAELDIDEDMSKSLVDKLSKSIKGRKTGKPTRFVYDSEMPIDLYDFIARKLKLKSSDNVIAGGRYHNFRDFIKFPSIGAQRLRYPALPALPHPDFDRSVSLLKVIAKKDILLYYPYESFNYVIDILREAAIDPKVRSIKITIYRLARQSKVINALVNAVKNGKDVTVVVELQARFDEEANIYWSRKMEDAGVKVIFGVPGLKVHSKLFLIARREGSNLKQYAYIGTGNFHEGTANLYTDHALLTSDKRLTNEVKKVFEFFNNNYKIGRYSHLLVSPVSTRRKFIQLIATEIKNAKAGKPAYIMLKLNSLLDEPIIKKLYEASQAGVDIQIIVRGICGLVPGAKGLSENIEARSIVDRFLEHSRIMIFCNDGNDRYFISSADWMGRNLDKRLEVTTPIYDKKLQSQLRNVLEIQLKDNVKARNISARGDNTYYRPKGRQKNIRSQIEIRRYYQRLIKEREEQGQ